MFLYLPTTLEPSLPITSCSKSMSFTSTYLPNKNGLFLRGKLTQKTSIPTYHPFQTSFLDTLQLKGKFFSEDKYYVARQIANICKHFAAPQHLGTVKCLQKLAI